LRVHHFAPVSGLIFFLPCYARGVPTVCVTCVWAGVDNAWEREKLEARKMLENAAESHTSGARFVGLPLWMQDSKPVNQNCRQPH